MTEPRGVTWLLSTVLALVPPRFRTGVARLIRFGIVGAIGFGVNEGLLFLCHGKLGLPLWLAQVVAIESAIVCNYLLNDRWTFHHPRPSFRRFLRFNSVSLVSLIVNFLVVQLATRFTSIHYLAANAVGVLLAFVANYTLNVYWAYGRALSDEERQQSGRPREAVQRTAPVDLPPDPV